MEREKIKIDILPNIYLNEDNIFDKDKALLLSGKIAGVCYDKEGFNRLKNENTEKTIRRVNMTLNNGHHSVYDHITINLNIHNIPKILAMVLNNEKEYTTSEKSARYTKVIRKEGSIITKEEENLYNKWIEIYKNIIKEKYGHIYNESKIQKLAQENARYLVTVFMPTEMIYSTSLRQINYIASFFKKYIDNNIEDKKDNQLFQYKLKLYMEDFIDELDRLNIIVDGLQKNEKNRELSLFSNNLNELNKYYSNIYSTTYEASFAYLAQAHRHRTLNYKMEQLKDKKYYVPPIISDDVMLVNEWISDMEKVSYLNPQGEIILINETGTYDNFILKCKERLCTSAQLEIMQMTRKILLEYKEYLEKNNDPLKYDIVNYTKGARCTFPDFNCPSPCHFKEGINLTRKI